MSETLSASHTVTATTGTIAQQLMRAVMDEVHQLPETWEHLSHGQQSRVIDRMGAVIDEAVAHAVSQIAMAGFEHARVAIEQLTAKPDAHKATLVLEREGAVAMLGRVGQVATIVFADPEVYLQAAKAIEAEADQRMLPFEVGQPETEDEDVPVLEEA